MPQTEGRSRTVRRILPWSMSIILVLSLAVWMTTRDRLPHHVRIATAGSGGLYHQLGEALAERLRGATGREVTVLETAGTGDNQQRLSRGEVELALMQADATDLEGLVSITPLYHEVVLLVVRRGRGIESFQDLATRRVSLGRPGSGMQVTSRKILGHYDLELGDAGEVSCHYTDLLHDESLDAAIVTAGLLSEELQQLLASGQFDLIGVGESAAFCLRRPSFQPCTIPRGLFGHRPALPAAPLTTVATTALLAAPRDTSPRLITAALRAVHESGLRSVIPTLMTRAEAAGWPLPNLDPVARQYFDPYGIDTFANFMESLAAGYELLFALAAGIYLLWERQRRRRERERLAEISDAKERLDIFLAETTRVERELLETTDLTQLKAHLEEVTAIKLRAIEELTEEELRGDRMFLIFLIQCGNLMGKIQARITNTILEQAQP
jgi:TRAP transporter TAXI family solute receptor